MLETKAQPLTIETPHAKLSAEKVQSDSKATFYDLPLLPQVQNAALMAGYETPSPIQMEIIPPMMEGRDVLAQSQTGTGKTAAFAMPILSRLEIRPGKPQVLVLTPTRELAIQVSKSFEKYAACQPGFQVATIYGGQSYDLQLRKLRQGVQVVVGTPGRVIDHVKRGTLNLGEVSCLVLDEADEMLNMGFLGDVQFVLNQVPDERQIALFSATLPGPIREIANDYLADPVRVTIKTKTMTADSIRQRALFVSHRDKLDTLKRILEAEETDGVIVFTKTKDATVTVAENLSRSGLLAVALNGDMPQRTRERTIERLKAGHLNILVATDVAARGLDVTRISHVFNYDMPHDSQSYVHRIGRTGRAGRKGEAFIFLSRHQRGQLKSIERLTRQPIEIVEPPTTNAINATRIQRFSKQIAEAIANEKAAAEIAMFKKMIEEFASESDHSMEMIAAALAHVAQRGKPFLTKEFPPRKKRASQHVEQTGSQGTQKRRSNRKFSPPAEGMTRYRIQVGRRDGVRPGNIVGAIANEASIEGQHIGPIEINHAYSTIDLPSQTPAESIQTLQNTRVAGRQLRISIDGEKPARGQRDHYPGSAEDSTRKSFSGLRNGKRNGKQKANYKISGQKKEASFRANKRKIRSSQV